MPDPTPDAAHRREWVCSPHGTRVESETEPKGSCPEADRAYCVWSEVKHPAAAPVVESPVVHDALLKLWRMHTATNIFGRWRRYTLTEIGWEWGEAEWTARDLWA